jgi:hypothetical protein
MRDNEQGKVEGAHAFPDESSGSVVSLHARRTASQPGPAHASAPHASIVTFDRRELSQILQLYGRKVAAGEWRDYALDFTKKRAVFSIYRRTSEVPLFRIEKDPSLRQRQGAYSVVASSGAVLRRGQDLARVIAVLEKPTRVI